MQRIPRKNVIPEKIGELMLKFESNSRLAGSREVRTTESRVDGFKFFLPLFLPAT